MRSAMTFPYESRFSQSTDICSVIFFSWRTFPGHLYCNITFLACTQCHEHKEKISTLSDDSLEETELGKFCK